METLLTTKDGVKSPGTDQAVLIEALSEREVEVLQQIAEGKTNREIASQLIVAPGTIKAHTASIYRKLDAKNRTEAVAIARQMNILK
jgi:DNA-binding NarL/FixJ family response regulator